MQNVLYHFPFVGDRLIIGRFCALARGAKFIMNGANQQMTGFSTYPFSIFGNDWEVPGSQADEPPCKGDTVIGNDVWIGYEAVIMPGVKVGDGASIAAKSVVARNVLPYTIVGGNPAICIRQRFGEDVVQALLEVAWWNWDISKITRHLVNIVAADTESLSIVSSLAVDQFS